MITNTIGNYYEDFIPGKIIKHNLSKTIFESDNNLFSLLTMNHHPVHINIDYASGEQYGKILVVGTLVFSVVVGLTVNDINPVFINDTLYARTNILDKRESNSKNDRGIIYVETIASNQYGKDVLVFKRRVLIKKKIYNGK